MKLVFRFKAFGVLCLVLLASFRLSAQQADSTFYDLSSPYGAALTIFYNLDNEHFHPELSGAALRSSNYNEQEKANLAIKFKQIYDGEGLLIDFSTIPRDPEFRDTTRNGRQRYVIDSFFPQLYLERVGEEWKLSEASVNKINELHREVYPFGTHRLLNLLPQMGDDEYFGLQLWQLLSILIWVVISVLGHKVITILTEYIIVRILAQFGYEKLAHSYLLPVAKPISIFFVLYVNVLFVRVLQLPIELTHYIIVIMRAVLPLVLTIAFYRLVDVISVYFTRMAAKTESTLDDQLVPLLRKTLKTFVVIIGTLFVLRYGLQIDIVPLLTGLSIGGLAFALAAQDTIKNFFGSLMIFIDKPFQIGDWITSGDIDGTVEEVGFRSTRIRTFRNSLTYVPNGKVADAVIDNHGLRKFRRFSTQLAITYDTPPQLISLFVEGLRKIVEEHPDIKKDNYHVYLNDLGAFSINVMFYVFFEVPTWGEELRARQEVLLKIIQLAESIGVRFAFPTQTLHMETFPEKKGLSPSYESDIATQKKAFESFFSKS